VLNEEDRDNCSFKGKTSKRLLKDEEEEEDGKEDAADSLGSKKIIICPRAFIKHRQRGKSFL